MRFCTIALVSIHFIACGGGPRIPENTTEMHLTTACAVIETYADGDVQPPARLETEDGHLIREVGDGYVVQYEYEDGFPSSVTTSLPSGPSYRSDLTYSDGRLRRVESYTDATLRDVFTYTWTTPDQYSIVSDGWSSQRTISRDSGGRFILESASSDGGVWETEVEWDGDRIDQVLHFSRNEDGTRSFSLKQQYLYDCL